MFKFFLTTALLLAIAQSQTDVNYRLNTPIKPSSYEITITPYFDTNNDLAFTFDGEVVISLFTESNIRQIKLHSEGLNYTAANISLTRGNDVVSLDSMTPLIFDEKYSFAYINFASELQAGIEYTLKIEYRGPIRNDLTGFYRNDYMENGVKKWLGTTQMEPTHARKVFPCFDEPSLKAIFKLTLDRPANFQPSVANTKMQTMTNLSNGYVRETFFPTPKMSTYLVAFLISEFEIARHSVEGTKDFGIYTRPDAVNQSDYAFDFGKRVVDALGNYFGIDYYSTDASLKLDHVALIDFNAGAMENWGLVTYRESLLLYVPEVSTPYFKYRVAQILAHETTHMWFGNLVTCHWWSNTWLNEGFANYFQDYITAMIEPEVGSSDQLVIGSVYSAYDADDDKNSVPITNVNVNSPSEISGHFGTITYQKAGSVIRMMHHLLGDEAFKMGLNVYLETNKFDSGTPELMYNALHYGATNTSALSAYPNFNIQQIMSSWISQAGHPVLHVNIDYDDETVTLKQERFYIDNDEESSETYIIPITYTTQLNPDFSNTKPAFIMDEQSHTFRFDNIRENHPWIIFNVQETGLYRVNYDEHSWEIIINALKGDDRERIHHLNRAKIINDLFALLFADEVDYNLLNNALEFVKKETDYSVIFAAVRGLTKLRNMYLGSDALEAIEVSHANVLDSIIQSIGYDVRAGEDTASLRNRMLVLEYACMIGHQGCIEHSVALFRKFRENGTEITPSLRPVSYCAGLRYGDGQDFEFLWNRMMTTNYANEVWVISYSLGCTTDDTKLKKYLRSVLEKDTPLKTQDLTVPFSSILSYYDNVDLVMEELTQNFNQYHTVFRSMDSILTTVGSTLHTEAEFDEFEEWLSNCSQCTSSALESARRSLGEARSTAGWAKGHKDEILRVIKSGATSSLPSIVLLVLALAMWLRV